MTINAGALGVKGRMGSAVGDAVEGDGMLENEQCLRRPMLRASFTGAVVALFALVAAGCSEGPNGEGLANGHGDVMDAPLVPKIVEPEISVAHDEIEIRNENHFVWRRCDVQINDTEPIYEASRAIRRLEPGDEVTYSVSAFRGDEGESTYELASGDEVILTCATPEGMGWGSASL